MAEFGEQLKKAREAKGLTQQSFAEKIYVTRQTVSRWESGTRFPDLHTAKKISEVLDVTIDDLLSGEEIQTNIEKIPVLDRTLDTVAQTVAYSIALLAYLLMSFFSWKEVLFPNAALRGTPAGEISTITITVLIKYTIISGVLLYGIINSAMRNMIPKKVAIVVSAPYIFAFLETLITYIDMRIKNNGHQSFVDLGLELLIPSVCVVAIITFYCKITNVISWIVIEMIATGTAVYVLYIYYFHLKTTTDLGFVVSSVHAVGMVGMSVLLGYQAFVFKKRKTLAIVD